jgi:hypothetical protein
MTQHKRTQRGNIKPDFDEELDRMLLEDKAAGQEAAGLLKTGFPVYFMDPQRPSRIFRRRPDGTVEEMGPSCSRTI